MKPSTLSLALALAAIAAVPAVSQQHPNILAACEEAANCETYTNAQGFESIQFKPSIKPSSANYKSRFPNSTEHGTIVKRYSHSHFTYGTNSINYGTTSAQDALAHCLWDYCKCA